MTAERTLLQAMRLPLGVATPRRSRALELHGVQTLCLAPLSLAELRHLTTIKQLAEHRSKSEARLVLLCTTNLRECLGC